MEMPIVDVKVEKESFNHEIFEYIRKRKGGKTHKVGVIFGTAINGVIKVGWSKCNMKAGDRFDLTYGLQLALSRAMGTVNTEKTPNCIRRQVRQFGGRCVRYFQDANKLELPM